MRRASSPSPAHRCAIKRKLCELMFVFLPSPSTTHNTDSHAHAPLHVLPGSRSRTRTCRCGTHTLPASRARPEAQPQPPSASSAPRLRRRRRSVSVDTQVLPAREAHVAFDALHPNAAPVPSTANLLHSATADARKSTPQPASAPRLDAAIALVVLRHPPPPHSPPSRRPHPPSSLLSPPHPAPALWTPPPPPPCGRVEAAYCGLDAARSRGVVGFGRAGSRGGWRYHSHPTSLAFSSYLRHPTLPLAIHPPFPHYYQFHCDSFRSHSTRVTSLLSG
ncbi:hypothetical protein C8J57DRAFT_1723170 [Mycena rebaudengoi]|nr:hypothetical protein C8J57DRAFT_1723170 [Mycena rebaudengoi]